jgi:hypothetical protein
MSGLVTRSLLMLGLPLALTTCPAVRAQPPEPDPLGTKAKAQALRAAERGDPKELLQAQREAARVSYEERAEAMRAGRAVAVDRPIAQSGEVLAAELRVANGAAERLAPLARHVARLGDIEAMTEQHLWLYPRWSRAWADYQEARADHLLAGLRLLEALGEAGHSSPRAPGAAVGRDPVDSKAAARDEFELTRGAPRALGGTALDATLSEVETRRGDLEAGYAVPLDVLFHASRRQVDLRRALGDRPADLLLALEAHWALALSIETITRLRTEAGIGMWSVAEAQDWRLEAESWLAEAGAGSRPRVGGVQHPLADRGDPLDTRGLARAEAAAGRADLRQLARERREVLLEWYASQLAELRRGRPVLVDVTLELLRRLAAVELVLASDRAERLAALERQWARACEFEDALRYFAEHTTLCIYFGPDLLEARAEHLRAEVWLIEARREK